MLYRWPDFLDNLSANFLKNILASLPIPPVVDRWCKCPMFNFYNPESFYCIGFFSVFHGYCTWLLEIQEPHWKELEHEILLHLKNALSNGFHTLLALTSNLTPRNPLRTSTRCGVGSSNGGYMDLNLCKGRV